MGPKVDPMNEADANAGYDTVIVMAHGSRNEAANLAHRELCSALAERLVDVRILPAFLELTEPLLPEVIGVEIDAGATRIAVLPYFLHPGNHTTRDIPGLVETARATHPGIAIDISETFGSDPSVVDLLATQIVRGNGIGRRGPADPASTAS